MSMPGRRCAFDGQEYSPAPDAARVDERKSDLPGWGTMPGNVAGDRMWTSAPPIASNWMQSSCSIGRILRWTPTYFGCVIGFGLLVESQFVGDEPAIAMPSVRLRPQRDANVDLFAYLPGPSPHVEIHQNDTPGSPRAESGGGRYLNALDPKEVRYFLRIAGWKDRKPDTTIIALKSARSLADMLKGSAPSRVIADGQQLFWIPERDFDHTLLVFWQVKPDVWAVHAVHRVKTPSDDHAIKAFRDYRASIAPVGEQSKAAFQLLSGYPFVDLNPLEALAPRVPNTTFASASWARGETQHDQLWVWIFGSAERAKIYLERANENSRTQQGESDALLRYGLIRSVEGPAYMQYIDWESWVAAFKQGMKIK